MASASNILRGEHPMLRFLSSLWVSDFVSLARQCLEVSARSRIHSSKLEIFTEIWPHTRVKASAKKKTGGRWQLSMARGVTRVVTRAALAHTRQARLWWDSQAGGLTAAGTPLDWPY